MEVFGVPIDNVSRADVLKQVETWLEGDTFKRIATVNPEFLLLAKDNPNFRQSLLAADLRLADGVGINFPFWLRGEHLIERFPGADLLTEVLRLAEEKGYTVGLALHDHGLSSPLQILAILKEQYPKLHCSLYSETYHSTPISYNLSPITYHLLLSNYGAPLQELYLESLREKNTGIRLAIGVGGAFDFLTGAIPRAPKWMQSIGLEWLWRLYQQPSRFNRIWNAVIVFPVKVLSQK